MRIKAIRFEPGTITTDLQRLDVVTSDEARLGEDVIGVWVSENRVPWHRVQGVKYFTDAAPLELPQETVRTITAVDRERGVVALGDAQPTKPTKKR